MKRIAVVLAAFFLLAACDKAMILSPDDGTIVSEDTVLVTGFLPEDVPNNGQLTVNGIPTTVNPDRTWEQWVPVDTNSYVTPILVKFRTVTEDGSPGLLIYIPTVAPADRS